MQVTVSCPHACIDGSETAVSGLVAEGVHSSDPAHDIVQKVENISGYIG